MNFGFLQSLDFFPISNLSFFYLFVLSNDYSYFPDWFMIDIRSLSPTANSTLRQIVLVICRVAHETTGDSNIC